MTTDSFRSHTRSLISPPEAAAALAPDDTARLPHVTRALYVGTGGDVVVEVLSGAVVRLANVQPGSVLPLRIVRVLASGTTAGDLVGLW